VVMVHENGDCRCKDGGSHGGALAESAGVAGR